VSAAAVACTQRYHYEQDWPLLRRESVTAFLAMSDDGFTAHLARVSPALPLALMQSGLAGLPLTELDKPVMRRCEELLLKPGAKPQAMLAAAITGSV